MPSSLIRLLADGRSQWLGPDGVVRDGLPETEAGDAVTVLVPAEDVLLLEIPRPAKQERQLRQALPYAIEDQLASAVEAQHVAWAAGSTPERVRVAVVADARMQQWLETLREAELEPDVLLPEALALPASPRAVLLSEEGRQLLRLADGRAFAGRTDELLAAANDLGAVDVWRLDDGPVPVPVHDAYRVAHPLLAFTAARAPLLNLLQGKYPPRRRASAAQRAWRVAGAMLGLALLLALASVLIDYYKLRGLVEGQEQEMTALYQQLVPGAPPAAQPLLQLQSILAAQGMGAGDPALGMLGRAAPALAADTRVALEALSYREGRLELQVQAPDLASLDSLRQRLVQAGLNAQITASTPGTQGVLGRLSLGAAP